MRPSVGHVIISLPLVIALIRYGTVINYERFNGGKHSLPAIKRPSTSVHIAGMHIGVSGVDPCDTLARVVQPQLHCFLLVLFFKPTFTVQYGTSVQT